MPGALPTKNDNYLCSAFAVSALTGLGEDAPAFVTGFEAVEAEASRAHHMLLYGCNRPNGKEGKIFDCQHHAVRGWSCC